MENRQIDRENIWGGNPDNFLPGVSVDCVIFTFDQGLLKILLTKYEEYHKWLLPGGFIGENEDLDMAAQRVLSKRTGIEKIYLKQFYTFGNAKRTDYDENNYLLKKISQISSVENDKWFLKRYLSVGFFAFANNTQLYIQTDTFQRTELVDIKNLPELYSDHRQIIDKAIEHITENIDAIPLGHELLPEKFTMTELRIIYETIFDRKLDRRNFQRKILSTGLVVKLKETEKKPGVKPATLFSFASDEQRTKKGYSIFE